MRFVSLLALLVACHPPGYDKHEDVDAAIPVDGTVGPTPDGTVTTATCAHAFRLDGHGSAGSVWLSGDFVHWAPTPTDGAIAFTKDAGGGWNGTYEFAPGPHQYKFIVDTNTWITDPTNPNTVDDGTGNTNSLYTCTP
jgi:hypothetical protein